MMKNKECLFCKIIDQEIPSFKIYENDYVYSFLDIFPNSDGHALVIPKVHVENFMLTPEPYASEVNKAKKVVAQILQDKLDGIQGFNFITNQEAIAGQVIFHYHEHILPKYIKGEGYLHDKNVNLKFENLSDIHEILKK